MVIGQARELPVAEEVGPAVPHVGQRNDLFVQEAGDDGRAHSLEPRLRRDRRHDPLVGLLDRDGEAVAVESELVVVLEGPGRFLFLPGRRDELADRFDRDLGGDLAGRVPAHSVGHDEEAFGDVHREGVLVVLALAADVGQAVGLDRGHQALRSRARSVRISSSALRTSCAEGSHRAASWYAFSALKRRPAWRKTAPAST